MKISFDAVPILGIDQGKWALVVRLEPAFGLKKEPKEITLGVYLTRDDALNEALTRTIYTCCDAP